MMSEFLRERAGRLLGLSSVPDERSVACGRGWGMSGGREKAMSALCV